MAEWSCPHSLVTPAGTITFNATGSTYLHDPLVCVGLDGKPLRIEQDNASLSEGGLLHTTRGGPRHLTIAGTLTTTDPAARNALEFALLAACESIENANGTYTWTPSGYSAKSLVVRCDLLPTFPGANLKKYIFGLVAANPAIA